MLPAEDGDCLWVEYGDEDAPHRILIDGGRLATWQSLTDRIQAIEGERKFELFVISHYDNDHIDTAVKLLNSTRSLNLKIDEVWFNEWQHLPSDELGAPEAEYAGAMIEREGLALNRHFQGKAVVLDEKVPLQPIHLPGGMRITLLSPRPRELARLRKVWASVIAKPGDREAALQELQTKRKYADELGAPLPNVQTLAEESTNIDNSVPNGSSIAFLAEFEGKSCLFGADAHPTVLAESLGRLAQGRTKVAVNAYKVSHHGSKYNTTKALLDVLSCRKYLVSSSGKLHGHPDEQAIARILCYGGHDPQLYFNYDSPQTRLWASRRLQNKYRYQTYLPPAGQVVFL
jgi:beta-lactamase superfamily II metal-dependent hydrolase